MLAGSIVAPKWYNAGWWTNIASRRADAGHGDDARRSAGQGNGGGGERAPLLHHRRTNASCRTRGGPLLWRDAAPAASADVASLRDVSGWRPTAVERRCAGP